MKWHPPEGMTPAKARKEVQRVAAVWEAEQLASADLQEAKVEESTISYTFGRFVDEVWIPLCVRDGSHRPSTVAMYTNILKVIVNRGDIAERGFIQRPQAGGDKGICADFLCLLFADKAFDNIYKALRLTLGDVAGGVDALSHEANVREFILAADNTKTLHVLVVNDELFAVIVVCFDGFFCGENVSVILVVQ